MTLERHNDRLRPVRGLVAAHNVRGRPYSETDIAKWLRLNRLVFKASKIDLLGGERAPRIMNMALDRAQELGFRLSLRSDCTEQPPDLQALAARGLLDLFLTPAKLNAESLKGWLDAAKKAALPVRAQLHPPFDGHEDINSIVDRFLSKGVTAVNLAAYDPFVDPRPCDSAEESRRSLEWMCTAANALESSGIEATIVRVPPEYLPEAQRHRAVTGAAYFLDHQQYMADAYSLAETIWTKNPIIAGKIIGILLGRHTLIDDPIDRKLLPWLLESPWLRARVVAWHRLTRHLRLTRAVPEAVVDSEAAYEKAVRKLEEGATTPQTTVDPAFRAAMPGLEPTGPVDGPKRFLLPPSTEHLKYYDAVDRERLELDGRLEALAVEAREIIASRPPDREIDSYDYAIEGQWCHQLPGGLRWHGFTNSEKLSTALSAFEPPFTLSVVFGGGIAEYIGFATGREARILSPMEAYGHRLTLHVAADGHYALLRDDEIVHPIATKGNFYIPNKLGTVTELKISIWNIDNSIVTQNVSVWSEALRNTQPRPQPKFTVITVCVRYARRLQAAMQSTFHQQGIDEADIEYIVAFVPGVDSTEDVLDSLEAAHPDARIKRIPFGHKKARAKGFMLNEALEQANGEWIILLDGDTLAPPNLLQQVIEHGDADFLVPDGRKLLSRETTARVLLGELTPWNDWDALMATAGEFRYREMDGVPIGFCQIVRRKCFDRVKYYEVDHFEGADWQFSLDMRKEFGPETRLSGTPVLHLDHGGSKWYGAERHY